MHEQPEVRTRNGTFVHVVEDDRAMRELLGKVLPQQQFAGVGASSDSDAIQLFAGSHFDLFLSDICMSLIDGNVLTQHARLDRTATSANTSQ